MSSSKNELLKYIIIQNYNDFPNQKVWWREWLNHKLIFEKYYDTYDLLANIYKNLAVLIKTTLKGYIMNWLKYKKMKIKQNSLLDKKSYL